MALCCGVLSMATSLEKVGKGGGFLGREASPLSNTFCKRVSAITAREPHISICAEKCSGKMETMADRW